MEYQIINGNNIDVLKQFPDNHFDSIVTDPPYGIDFLGKEWDANTGALETYQECLRVLKPGGHILAFSAARTYHHLAITLEQAGFEIRDQIMWIYSSGFPKSQDVGKSIQRSLGVKETKKATGPKSTTPRKNNYKNILAESTGNNRIVTDDYDQVDLVVCTDEPAKQWEGWGTALKPAHEPICMARKPVKTSIAKNCQQWGVGALNIDASRVAWSEDDDPQAYIDWMKKYPSSTGSKAVFNNAHADAKGVEYIKDQDAEINENRNVDNRMSGRFPSNVIGEVEQEYQKYFYCPKVSRKERHIGFDTADIPTNPNGILDNKDENGNQVLAIDSKRLGMEPGNNHPTVKPVALMEYLIKLITPPGGTVLDPFNGSGSTGMAAVNLGHKYVGIELDSKYVEISKKRIEAWMNRDLADNNFEELFVEDLEDDDEQ